MTATGSTATTADGHAHRPIGHGSGAGAGPGPGAGAEALDVFRAISDPARRAILDLLAAGERAVSDLLPAFSFSQPALSKHLRVLREAGLVTPRREGRRRLYRLEAARLREVHDWVGHYQAFWTGKLDELGRLLDESP